MARTKTTDYIDLVTLHLPLDADVVVAVLQAVAKVIPEAVVRDGGYGEKAIIALPLIEAESDPMASALAAIDE